MHCHGIALWRWLSWHRLQVGAATALVGVLALLLFAGPALLAVAGLEWKYSRRPNRLLSLAIAALLVRAAFWLWQEVRISRTDIGIHAHSAAHRSSRRPEPGTARPPAAAKRGSNATHAPPTRGWRSGQRAVSASCGAQASPIPSRPNPLLAMASLTHYLRRAAFASRAATIKVFVQRGQLVVEDGIGRDRRRRAFNRATHGISRLLVLGSDGFISLEAIRWLHRLGIALVHLDRDGNILATSSPRSGNVRLRRLQAAAGGGQTGIEIARMLLQAKLDGQARVLDLLGADAAAGSSVRAATAALAIASTLDQLVWAERDAALAYWTAWARVEVPFKGKGRRAVPEHWLSLGQRGSLLTKSPRLAINPANAILNYLYAILEAETRLACLTLGLDPGLGIVHADYRSRDSFALDLMEAARPAVDAHVLEMLQTRPSGAATSREARGSAGSTRRSSRARRDRAALGGGGSAGRRGCRHAARELRGLADQGGLDAAHRPQPISTLRRQTAPRHGAGHQACSAGADLQAVQWPSSASHSYLLRRLPPPLPARAHEKAFHGSGLAAIEQKKAAGTDPTHGATAAARRAGANVTRKREAREWDEQHGKLVDLSAFERDILPVIQDIPLSRLQAATGLSLRYVP